MSHIPPNDLTMGGWHRTDAKGTLRHKEIFELMVDDDRILQSSLYYKPWVLPPEQEMPWLRESCLGNRCSWGWLPRNMDELKLWHILALNGNIGRLERDLNESVDTLISDKLLGSIIPHPVIQRFQEHRFDKISSLHQFSSGSEAINGAYDLLAQGKKGATTWENGSAVVNYIKEKITLRNEENKPIDDNTLFKEWHKAVYGEKKCRFLSFTLISKTGRRYDALGKRVAKMVADHNKKFADDQITLIMDAVQVVGREQPEDAFHWLGEKGVAGVAHSGSKAPGGLAHAGFLWLSEEGIAQLEKADHTDESHLTIMKKRGWANYMFVHPESVVGPEEEKHQYKQLAIIARGIDNVKAITDIITLQQDPVYKIIMEKVRKRYIEMFERVGFQLVDKDVKESRQTASLLAFTHPEFNYSDKEKDLGEYRRKFFDNHLYENGAAPGGYLHDKKTKAMFRWGINSDVVEAIMNGFLDYKTFYEKNLKYLESILSGGLEKSRLQHIAVI